MVSIPEEKGALREEVAALDHSYHLQLPDCVDTVGEHTKQVKSGIDVILYSWKYKSGFPVVYFCKNESLNCTSSQA
jgi:hypothetical protein